MTFPSRSPIDVNSCSVLGGGGGVVPSVASLKDCLEAVGLHAGAVVVLPCRRYRRRVK